MWTKKVKYDVRKNFADSRIRIKGRFVKKDEEQAVLCLVKSNDEDNDDGDEPEMDEEDEEDESPVRAAIKVEKNPGSGGKGSSGKSTGGSSGGKQVAPTPVSSAPGVKKEKVAPSPATTPAVPLLPIGASSSSKKSSSAIATPVVVAPTPITPAPIATSAGSSSKKSSGSRRNSTASPAVTVPLPNGTASVPIAALTYTPAPSSSTKTPVAKVVTANESAVKTPAPTTTIATPAAISTAPVSSGKRSVGKLKREIN